MNHVYKCLLDIVDILCIAIKASSDLNSNTEKAKYCYHKSDFIPVNLLEPFIHTGSMKLMMTRKCSYSVSFFILHKAYVTSKRFQEKKKENILNNNVSSFENDN